jgi:hypothetical protein
LPHAPHRSRSSKLCKKGSPSSRPACARARRRCLSAKGLDVDEWTAPEKSAGAAGCGVTVDVQPPQDRPAVHGLPPDSGVDRLALPGDNARQTQIERKQGAIASFYTGTITMRETDLSSIAK